jgi:hypothetical protein
MGRTKKKVESRKRSKRRRKMWEYILDHIHTFIALISHGVRYPAWAIIRRQIQMKRME